MYINYSDVGTPSIISISLLIVKRFIFDPRNIKSKVNTKKNLHMLLLLYSKNLIKKLHMRGLRTENGLTKV